MQQAVCVRRNTTRKKYWKFHRTRTTPPKPPQPDDRDSLEMTCNETSAASWPRLALSFYGSQVCGNSVPYTSRSQLLLIPPTNRTHTYGQTARKTTKTLKACRRPGMKRLCCSLEYAKTAGSKVWKEFRHRAVLFGLPGSSDVMRCLIPLTGQL